MLGIKVFYRVSLAIMDICKGKTIELGFQNMAYS